MSFTSPELMRTLIMKLPHIEVKFYPDVKSQTDLSSLRVSCKRALRCFTQVQFKSFSHWENTSGKFFKVNNQDIRVTCRTSFYDCIPYIAPFPLLLTLNINTGWEKVHCNLSRQNNSIQEWRDNPPFN